MRDVDAPGCAGVSVFEEDSIVIDVPKQAIRWSGFKPRHNHAGHLFGVAELADTFGVTIPGLTLQIEIKAPVDSQRCLFLFSVMQLVQKKRVRTYQLEVAPITKRTHNGKTPIYGPHEHVGDKNEPTPVVSPDVSCDNWSGCLQWFFNRVSVAPFPIENPNGHVEL